MKVYLLMMTAAAAAVAQVPDDCLGSVQGERKLGSYLLITTKLTPSAGCVVVLSAAREWKATLRGLLLTTIGEKYLIFQENQIHFSPVKPTHVLVHDLARNATIAVYPLQEDPERTAYAGELRKRVDLDWCRQNNAPCDPVFFNDFVGPVEVGTDGRQFGLDVTFVPDGFGPRAEREVGRRRVRYVFHLKDGQWTYEARK